VPPNDPPGVAIRKETDMTKHTDTGTKRALVLQVLERPGPCSRAELEVALGDVEPLAISDALRALEAEGVVSLGGEQVWASRCVRHLDEMGLIAL
jgi:DNA-binding HxlR family transcriptional regulator